MHEGLTALCRRCPLQSPAIRGWRPSPARKAYGSARTRAVRRACGRYAAARADLYCMNESSGTLRDQVDGLPVILTGAGPAILKGEVEQRALVDLAAGRLGKGIDGNHISRDTAVRQDLADMPGNGLDIGFARLDESDQRLFVELQRYRL